MLSKEQIFRFEQVYKRNLDIVEYWDTKLMKRQSHNEWMKTVHQRSAAMRLVYLENQQEIKLLSQGLKEDMNVEIRTHLYEMLMRLFYMNKYDDAVLMIRIIDALLPYYEKENDIIHMINLLHVKGHLSSEYFYRQTRHPEMYSLDQIHMKINHFTSMYKTLPEKERRIIICNYFNITCSLPMILPHEANRALDIYDKFLDLIHDKEVIALDQFSQGITSMKENTMKGIWNIAEILESFDQLHLLHFYDLIKKAFQEKNVEEESIDSDSIYLISAYYYTSAYLNEHHILNTGICWQKAYDYLYKTSVSLLDILEHTKIGKIDNDFLMKYIYPYQESTFYMFKVFKSMTPRPDTASIRRFIKRGTSFLCDIPKEYYTWLIHAIQSEWCENALGILDNTNDQKELINNIVVNGQVQTYIHSQMVGLLASCVLKYIIKQKPELLLSLPDVSSVEMIRKHEDAFIDFINEAALYHDIGKGRISSVINQQTRALVEQEFKLIKEHPEHPETGVLKDAINFTQYFDIIAGHHKSYDGLGGYPLDFDAIHSPYRILIDLISICDCLDAATDLLGRNYAGGKDLDTIIDEFIKGKGTRYNPDIVDLISSTPELHDELKDIVNNGRDEVYYETYKQYFS